MANYIPILVTFLNIVTSILLQIFSLLKSLFTRIFLLPKSQKLEMQPYYSQSWHENATQWHIPMSLLVGSASPPHPTPPWA